MKIEERIKELGYELPEVKAPAFEYIPLTRSGSTVYISGQMPWVKGALVYTGKVPSAVTIEQAQESARTCVLNALAALKAEIGDLDKVVRILKVVGFVNGEPDFTEQPLVINGASILLGQIFGEAGRHARSAVGAGGLPRGTPVEIEFVIEVKD